jgi:ferredoxin
LSSSPCVIAMKVIIDEEVCIGCESCAEVCPEVFRFNPDIEKAEVILPAEEPVDCIEDAMDAWRMRPKGR